MLYEVITNRNIKDDIAKDNTLAGEGDKTKNKANKVKDSAQQWRNLGDKYRSEKKYDDALKAYRKATESDKNDDHSFYWMGRIYTHNKMYDEAIDSFHNATLSNPKNGDAHYRLGLLNYMKKRYRSAIDSFNKRNNFV